MTIKSHAEPMTMKRHALPFTDLLAVGVVFLLGLLVPCVSLAASPWWHLTSISRPSVLQPEGVGQVVLTVANLGDGGARGETDPVTITDVLPGELHALTIEALAGEAGNFGSNDGPVKCVLKTLTCTFAGTLPPFDQIEVRIGVKVGSGAASGELNRMSVSGGEASTATISRALEVGGEPTPFGLANYELDPEEEGGGAATQAGAHPFQLTTTLDLNQTASNKSDGQYNVSPVSLVKDLNVKLPPGLIGNPTPFPRCTLSQFLRDPSGNETDCPPQTVLGVAIVTIDEPSTGGLGGVITFTVPVVNLDPTFGEPARFGFLLPITPVFIDTSVRSNGDYGITASSLNTSETAAFLDAQVTFWGTPGDPRHDAARGSGCLARVRGHGSNVPCAPLEQNQPPSFMILPTACEGALPTSVELNSWALPAEALSVPVSVPLTQFDGCNRLPFSPHISAEPSTDRASAPTGLDFNLDFHDEGLTSSGNIAESQVKNTTVTLPEGLTINPSAGVGLGGCTQADYDAETLTSAAGAGCPNDSKLGTVEVTTPLLSTAIHGSLYIAQPHENPFGSLVALYIVLKNPETGILVKQAGKVIPDPVTGQLTTTFEGIPQLPFAHFNFHFREGQQAPLISPATCGTYTTHATLNPWSAPDSSVGGSSAFTITRGFDGGACPSGGVPPFAPQIQAGMLNNNAGSFSPLYVRLTRGDADQEISGFSTNLPAGLTGDLSGIPFCPEADVALARTKTGTVEEASPSCPAASQIGRTLVGTGAGAVLAYVPGKVYLAGPYAGDPLSVLSVTSAVVGPFDLGTVVIRFGLRIDPNTAQVSVDPSASEPIPTIIDGIVTHVRDIRVYIDRPGFTLNPTSCAPLAIASTLNSNLGHSVTISSPFQGANCANLAFKPSFKVSTNGKTSRKNGASLTVKLAYPNAPQGTQANIRSVKVDLPKQLPSRLSTLQKACTEHQFAINPAGCPAASAVGYAKAITPILPVPIEGPAYFVSHGGAQFPELIIVLQGYGITIDLHGETFIDEHTGVTSSTFRTVPDQPVTTFTLTLPQGPNSALAANTNLCNTKHGLHMPTTFHAQNGATLKQNTKITITNCPKAKHKKTTKTSRRHHR